MSFKLQENIKSGYLHVGFHCTLEPIFSVSQFKVFPHLVFNFSDPQVNKVTIKVFSF
jgi:hypothetical protein